MSLSEVADELGTTLRTVHRRLIEYRIPRRRSGPRAGHETRPATWYNRASGVLTRDFLIKNYTRKGMTVAQIAEETGFHQSTVLNSLHRLGIPLHNTASFIDHIDPRQLARLRRNGLTVREIAMQLGCSSVTIHRATRQYDIPRPRRSVLDRIDPKRLARLRRQGLTVAEIAERFGYSKRNVERALQHFGLSRRSSSRILMATTIGPVAAK